ncbi:MAG TPA: YitT family protein [Bacteroidales bacterium]|nr:YitT family protein [Bacteroidales bacterium]
MKNKDIKNTSEQLLYLKRVAEQKSNFRGHLRDGFLIIIAVVSASFGLKAFLLPNHFIDGGVMGISLITTKLSGIPLSYLIVAINLPFVFLGFSTISRNFAFRSIIAIVLLAISVHFLPIDIITNDKLLVSVFGGFFLGLGIGFAIRGGAVIDGTEILAVYISRKTPLTIGNIILIFNIVIFLFAAYVFSIETALYAILTYLVASKTVDFVVTGVEEYIGVTIISIHNKEIRLAIVENLGRGCTIYKGQRGFAKRGEPLNDIDIVYTVITRLELSKLQSEINKIDKDAFVIMNSIKDAKGGMIKKRRLN